MTTASNYARLSGCWWQYFFGPYSGDSSLSIIFKPNVRFPKLSLRQLLALDVEVDDILACQIHALGQLKDPPDLNLGQFAGIIRSVVLDQGSAYVFISQEVDDTAGVLALGRTDRKLTNLSRLLERPVFHFHAAQSMTLCLAEIQAKLRPVGALDESPSIIYRDWTDRLPPELQTKNPLMALAPVQ